MGFLVCFEVPGKEFKTQVHIFQMKRSMCHTSVIVIFMLIRRAVVRELRMLYGNCEALKISGT